MGNTFSGSILTDVERIKYEILRTYIRKVKPELDRNCFNDEEVVRHMLEIHEYLDDVFNSDNIDEKNKLMRYLDDNNCISINNTTIKTDAWGYEY